ncbi:MAG: hypothetical protein HC827_19060 [Cyanobacteria bacterium RM1_2_2]|nr:hypothetical protein [Cyanobacteria bacterium RM1_2_2]
MLPKSLLVWFRLLRIKIHPWTRVLIAGWNVIFAKDCHAATTRWMMAFAKLDHLSFVSLLNDCLC